MSAWYEVMADKRYSTFEDPFSGMCVPKDEFNAVYGEACCLLLMDLRVEMVFQENPVVQGEWRYSDDDARDDVYDTAVELGLVYSSDEVRQGETFEEEAKRKKKQQQRPQKRAESLAEKGARFVKVEELLAQEGLSGKQRKKLIREQRGLAAAIESSSKSQ